ncbi:RNA polymerase sigma factor [Streptomyces auratus]|uniref:Sigma-70 family RNA polymerase sigma factor n=1 Tax=Streptomyces auratus AGR0001 TaxID=1160718 RepID=J2JWT4_9ACTN|nr:sigma-70 family RNA polymerase sigma factor [Streptomyces auratus AGR0001]
MSTDDAFAEAYRAHYWAVSRFVARRLDGQAHEVEEVVAEVFSTAWRRRAELPDAPLPWLYGVARNCLANTVRGRGRYRRLLHRLGHHEASQRRQTVDSPDAERPGSWVHEALARLSPADQEVLRLTAWEELTVGELAVTLGCGQSAAAMRLHRARGRLRTQIERMRQKDTARSDTLRATDTSRATDGPPADAPPPAAPSPSPPAPRPATPLPLSPHHPVPTRSGGRRHD